MTHINVNQKLAAFQQSESKIMNGKGALFMQCGTPE